MKKREKDNQRIKKPWPTKDAMEQVYTNKLWGRGEADFYSGEGSHSPEIVKPYIESVSSFLSSLNNQLIVCDLGCGDFNVGKELVKYTKKYVAIDIVHDLIYYNKENFQSDNLEFHCLDIAEDDLPFGDCAIVRQVLQHLSNAEIQRIVSKLSAFKYVILTEHIPAGDFMPNRDIISGQGNRVKIRSGVDLLAEPFNMKVEEREQLSSVVLEDGKGVIASTLYTMFTEPGK